jgi:hypothetical protein
MTIRFIKSNIEEKFKRNYKEGNIFVSCVEARSELYAKIGLQHSLLTKKNSFIFFTNKRIYKSFIKKHKENNLVKFILINLSPNNKELKNRIKKGWLMLSSLSHKKLQIFLHNCHSSIATDRNIKHSRAGFLSNDELIGYIASYLFEEREIFKKDFFNKNSFIICEGTTLIDHILCFILNEFGVGTIIPSHSRIPQGKMVIHKDLYETNFLKEEQSKNIDINFLNNSKIIEYSEICLSQAELLYSKKYKSFAKRIIRNIYRYFYSKIYNIDSFNRTSISTSLDVFLCAIFKKKIIYFINFLNQEKIKNCNKIIYYMHVTPERSVDVLSDLPKEQNQNLLLKNICKNLSENQKLIIVPHPSEIRISQYFFIFCLFFKYKNVVLKSSYNKYENNYPVVSIAGSIIQERSLRNLPTYHCCDIYIAKGLNKIKYINGEHLLSLIEKGKHKEVKLENPSEILPSKSNTHNFSLFTINTKIEDIRILLNTIYDSYA